MSSRLFDYLDRAHARLEEEIARSEASAFRFGDVDRLRRLEAAVRSEIEELRRDTEQLMTA